MISLSKFKQFSDHYISTLTNLKVFISRLKPEKKTIISLQYKIHTSLKIKDHIGNFTRTIVSHSVPSNFHLSGPMKDGSDETVITAVKRKSHLHCNKKTKRNCSMIDSSLHSIQTQNKYRRNGQRKRFPYCVTCRL